MSKTEANNALWADAWILDFATVAAWLAASASDRSLQPLN